MTTPVEPVQALPPTTGLVASARPPRDNTERWEQGFAWRPETCIAHQGYTPCGEVSGAPEDLDIGAVYYFPPGYRVRDYCTTLGGELDAERVRRQAEAAASWIVAQELWTGSLTEADPAELPGGAGPYVNPYLANGNAEQVTPATWQTSILQRLVALESAARDAAKGQQVFLHVPPAVLADIEDYIRRQGNLIYTPLDSVVVADAGYPGTGDITPGTSEVQQVTITDATGGTFTLTWDGETTDALAYNATPAQVGSALAALPSVESGDVTVTGSAGDYTLTFNADLGNVSQVTIDGSALTGDPGTTPNVAVATTTDGVADTTSEVQTVQVTGAVGGTFTLTLDTETTSALAYNAAPADVQAALEALTGVGSGNVTVTGSAGDYTATFASSLGDLPQMTADGSSLEGEPAVTPTTSATTTTEGSGGSAEAGLWAYATGPVQVRLSPVEVLDEAPETIDRSINRQEIWASRLFAATFDPCIHLSIQLDA